MPASSQHTTAVSTFDPIALFAPQRAPDWVTDVYNLRPDVSALFRTDDLQGEITGYSLTDTTDQSPGLVASRQTASTAHLHSTLYVDDIPWVQVCNARANSPDPSGRVEEK